MIIRFTLLLVADSVLSMPPNTIQRITKIVKFKSADYKGLNYLIKFETKANIHDACCVLIKSVSLNTSSYVYMCKINKIASGNNSQQHFILLTLINTFRQCS